MSEGLRGLPGVHVDPSLDQAAPGPRGEDVVRDAPPADPRDAAARLAHAPTLDETPVPRTQPRVASSAHLSKGGMTSDRGDRRCPIHPEFLELLAVRHLGRDPLRISVRRCGPVKCPKPLQRGGRLGGSRLARAATLLERGRTSRDDTEPGNGSTPGRHGGGAAARWGATGDGDAGPKFGGSPVAAAGGGPLIEELVTVHLRLARLRRGWPDHSRQGVRTQRVMAPGSALRPQGLPGRARWQAHRAPCNGTGQARVSRVPVAATDAIRPSTESPPDAWGMATTADRAFFGRAERRRSLCDERVQTRTATRRSRSGSRAVGLQRLRVRGWIG